MRGRNDICAKTSTSDRLNSIKSHKRAPVKTKHTSENPAAAKPRFRFVKGSDVSPKLIDDILTAKIAQEIIMLNSIPNRARRLVTIANIMMPHTI